MSAEVSVDLEQHVCVFGRSSSGKTTFVRERLFNATRKRVVFFNSQREAGFGREVQRWSPALLRPRGAHINLVSPRPSAGAKNQAAARHLLETVVDHLIAVGEAHTSPARETHVVVMVDEAHLIAPKHSQDDPLSLLATNGKRYGITFVAITQRPAKLSHTVISQAPVHVQFDVDEYEAPYLREYAVPEWVQRYVSDAPPGQPPGTPSHRFAVRRGKMWHACTPITPGRA